MAKYVSVDLETSGLDPAVHEIIEVGLVTDGKKLTFSLPWSPELADPKALEVNRALERELPPQLEEREGLELIAEWLDDAHIVGKNPAFDRAFLQDYFETDGIKCNWHHRVVDVGALAWGYHHGKWMNWNRGQANRGELQNLVLEPPNLGKTAELMGIHLPTGEAAHTALADAELCWEIFRKIVPAG